MVINRERKTHGNHYHFIKHLERKFFSCFDFPSSYQHRKFKNGDRPFP
jgi:hypothetical protein